MFKEVPLSCFQSRCGNRTLCLKRDHGCHHIIPIRPCASPSAGTRCPFLWQHRLWGKSLWFSLSAVSEPVLWGSALSGVFPPWFLSKEITFSRIRSQRMTHHLGVWARSRDLCLDAAQAVVIIFSTSSCFLPGKSFFQPIRTVIKRWTQGFRKEEREQNNKSNDVVYPFLVRSCFKACYSMFFRH